MVLSELMAERRESVLTEAAEAMRRSHLEHYDREGSEATAARLARLYDLTEECARSRRVTPMVAFAESVAQARFRAGFDLFEVQTAFNVVEEAIWKRILVELRGPELGEALAAVSTILGQGKDALARAYVALASERPA